MHDLPVGLLDLVRLAGVRDHVRIVVAHLQEALNASGRMLGTLALIAVRQEHHKARLTEPEHKPTTQTIKRETTSEHGSTTYREV